MATGGMGWQLNIEQRSLSQSIWGNGKVAIESAGSSAPYWRAIEARMVIAFTPASLLMGHLPLASNHCPPSWETIGLNWIIVHCAACMADLKPRRGDFFPLLVVSRLGTPPPARPLLR